MRSIYCSLILCGLLCPCANRPAAATDPPGSSGAAKALPAGAVCRLGTSRFSNFGHVHSLAYSSDSKRLVAGCWDGTIWLWDLETNQVIRHWQAHDRLIAALAFAPDGLSLASTGREGEIRLWSTRDERLRSALKGPAEAISHLVFSSDGKTLASKGRKMLTLWQLTGKAKHEYAAEGFSTPAYSADGASIRFVDHQNAALVTVSAMSGKEMSRLPLPPRTLDLSDYFFLQVLSPTGSLLARTGYGADHTGLVHVLRLDRMRLAFSWKFPLNEPRPFLVFCPDERSLAVGLGSKLLVLELATGQVRAVFDSPDEEQVCLAWSPDCRVLASGSLDRTVLLWDLTGGRRETKLGVALSKPELARRWDELESADAQKAYGAMWALVAGKESVPFLAGKLLTRTAVIDADKVRSLVKQLNDPSPEVRERASAELGKIHDAAEPYLRDVLKKPVPLESRRRLEIVLQQIDAWWAKQWRPVRAVETLERIGTTEARRLLRQLERQASSPRLSREAQETLMRLERIGGP